MYKKKLIEVALPLEAINAASAKEKSIRHGHPSTLHLWWARRPLAACRAVLFASLVDDPSARPEEFPTEEDQERERQRLFGIIERLVLWENTNNEQVLDEARQEILRSTDGNPPPVLDPFCGGGSIPLEAQRLGLEAHASDLNPVAVLITKAMIEIPPKFVNQPPVNPEARRGGQKRLGEDWPGASGLAEDVRYYGKWMRDEAEKRIGHLYPKAKLPNGKEATVIAWIWARTVKCPNPACGAKMPLVRSFALSTKKGKKAWVEPVIDPGAKTVKFEVKTGSGIPPDPPKIGRGAKFRCLVCGQVAEDQHIKAEGTTGRMGEQLMAIVAKGTRERVYLSPDGTHEKVALQAEPIWGPRFELAGDKRAIWCPLYGLDTFDKLFTPRQLVALTTFSDLVGESRERALRDAVEAGLQDDGIGINDGGKGAHAYSDAVITYLGLAVSRSANTHCTLSIWSQSRDQSVNAFSRQALPMNWDYPEVNPFAGAAGDIRIIHESIVDIINNFNSKLSAFVSQSDSAQCIGDLDALPLLISTDPPYYDNIGYADLSDFFYVWLRRSLGSVYPDLLSTILVPKAQELVAIPYRFNGSREDAEKFFEEGLRKALALIRKAQNPNYPLTVYYAYKQAEGDDSTGRASTGWDVMLESLIKTSHEITGTWPMRTERPTGVKVAVNALASSIVLVCRPRPEGAPLTTRRDFIASMKKELPEALRELQQGSIAPVDLAQSAIGPGMAIFSRYSKVVEPDGSPMSVRSALQLINQHLDEFLAEQENEYDPDTRWALAWFEQYGMKEGPFGDAETLSKAKNTSVEGMVQSGILKAGGGKVRLLKRDELKGDWDPSTDKRMNVWEMTQHLIRVLDEEGGESPASELQERLGGAAEIARDLAYRLYSICERKGWTQEALSYNSLVAVWPRLRDLATEKREEGRTRGEQQPLEV